MKRLLRVAIIIAAFFTAGSAFAACHTVTPSGSGSKNGADWNNALAGLPSNPTRGDIYYLADGSYGSYSFSAAASGTLTVEFRKAQPYDNCTSTGWNTSTMGSSQAVLTGFAVTTSYVIVNGNGTSMVQGCGGAPGPTVAANPPTPSDCGIKIDNSTCGNTGANSCDAPIPIGNFSVSGAVTGYTFEYIELKGQGDNAADQMEVWAPFNGTGNAGTFLHDYMHNAGCVYLQDGADSRTVAYSYFWGTEVNGAIDGTCHGQYSFSNGNDSNSIEHNNIYRDITGTAVWTFASGGGTHTNWQFYNNIIWDTNSGVALGNLSDGIIACINTGSICSGFVFYQNTIVNVGGNSGINNENAGSYTIENNLWYGIPGQTAFATGTAGKFIENHNSFLASVSSCSLSIGDVCDDSAPSPFTNWQAGNFTLVSDKADWNNRASLAEPYTVDAAGNTFTTDRGAYEYGGSIIAAPKPPTGLTATAQ
jgi:hypothetical protein